MLQQPSNGAGGAEALLEGGFWKFPASASADGRFILFNNNSHNNNARGVWVLPASGDHTPKPLVQAQGTVLYNREEFAVEGFRRVLDAQHPAEG